ncbi:hypothetical protein [Sanguibacter suaedae]|uniref:Integral membrane protein n=1 Tax=Sanguibacter suaedae TaxID=2795737 RepID=A0A934IAM6_9MICO|nr:hypothetical protein [Sanguibacter suaedae]MBI9114270.1 hypothetical protein [Sanguibacter suaedae]
MQRTPTAPSSPSSTSAGFGRLLVLVYGILAVAATVRGAYQLATDGASAPLAYGLSLGAGVVYVVATLALGRGTPGARRVAWVACAVELGGVLAVGVATIVDADAFPEATVWSSFGQGYGYVPLVLPVVGLVWLARTRRGAASSTTVGPATDPTDPTDPDPKDAPDR